MVLFTKRVLPKFCERKQLEEQERNAREEKLEEDRKRLESEKASFWVKPESCHVTFAANLGLKIL